MLTQNMYLTFAEALKDQQPLFIAVGAGEPAWDQTPPGCSHRTTQLDREVARKAVLPEAVAYLDEDDAVVAIPTPRVQIVAAFGEGEAVGPLREYGLFGGEATAAPDTGDLLAYYVHDKLDKEADETLVRRIIVDLTPRMVAPDRPVTPYLGNVHTRELHDLDNLTPQCQIDEIRRDRRFYFESVEDARAMDYDLCAYCFGPEQSER